MRVGLCDLFAAPLNPCCAYLLPSRRWPARHAGGSGGEAGRSLEDGVDGVQKELHWCACERRGNGARGRVRSGSEGQRSSFTALARDCNALCAGDAADFVKCDQAVLGFTPPCYTEGRREAWGLLWFLKGVGASGRAPWRRWRPCVIRQRWSTSAHLMQASGRRLGSYSVHAGQQ